VSEQKPHTQRALPVHSASSAVHGWSRKVCQSQPCLKQCCSLYCTWPHASKLPPKHTCCSSRSLVLVHSPSPQPAAWPSLADGQGCRRCHHTTNASICCGPPSRPSSSSLGSSTQQAPCSAWGLGCSWCFEQSDAAVRQAGAGRCACTGCGRLQACPTCRCLQHCRQERQGTYRAKRISTSCCRLSVLHKTLHSDQQVWVCSQHAVAGGTTKAATGIEYGLTTGRYQGTGHACLAI
jgi:hypothetical protein